MKIKVLLCAVFFAGILLGCQSAVKVEPQKQLPADEFGFYEEGWDAQFQDGVYETFENKIKKGELTPIQIKPLSGYFLKTTVKLTQNTNLITINSTKKLEEMLGNSQLAKAGNINFAKSFISVIALSPSTNVYTIKVLNAYAQGSQLYITYSIENADDIGARYFRNDYLIFEVERPKIVTTVHFIDNNKRGIKLYYGRRSVDSPKNVRDIRLNYTGTYKGVLTSQNSDDNEVITQLQILPDFTFILKQSYKDNESRVFETTGIWAPTEDLSSFVLNYDKSEREQLKFYFINKKSIEQLHFSGDRLDTGKNVLKR